MTALDRVIAEVRAERERQDVKWGEQNHDLPMWLAILSEEVGEVAKDVVEHYVKGYREELIQVAAVAISAVQALDRKSGGVA